MDELKTFIKGLRDANGDPDEEARKAFADRCQTSIGHLRNVAYGTTCSPELAAFVETASCRAVRRWHLRPKDWHHIWPELVGIEGAPLVPTDADSAEVKAA